MSSKSFIVERSGLIEFGSFQVVSRMKSQHKSPQGSVATLVNMVEELKTNKEAEDNEYLQRLQEATNKIKTPEFDSNVYIQNLLELVEILKENHTVEYTSSIQELLAIVESIVENKMVCEESSYINDLLQLIETLQKEKTLPSNNRDSRYIEKLLQVIELLKTNNQQEEGLVTQKSEVEVIRPFSEMQVYFLDVMNRRKVSFEPLNNLLNTLMEMKFTVVQRRESQTDATCEDREYADKLLELIDGLHERIHKTVAKPQKSNEDCRRQSNVEIGSKRGRKDLQAEQTALIDTEKRLVRCLERTKDLYEKSKRKSPCQSNQLAKIQSKQEVCQSTLPEVDPGNPLTDLLNILLQMKLTVVQRLETDAKCDDVQYAEKLLELIESLHQSIQKTIIKIQESEDSFDACRWQCQEVSLVDTHVSLASCRANQASQATARQETSTETLQQAHDQEIEKLKQEKKLLEEMCARFQKELHIYDTEVTSQSICLISKNQELECLLKTRETQLQLQQKQLEISMEKCNALGQLLENNEGQREELCKTVEDQDDKLSKIQLLIGKFDEMGKFGEQCECNHLEKLFEILNKCFMKLNEKMGVIQNQVFYLRYNVEVDECRIQFLSEKLAKLEQEIADCNNQNENVLNTIEELENQLENLKSGGSKIGRDDRYFRFIICF